MKNTNSKGELKMRKSVILAIINAAALCLVILAEKILFRRFNIGFQNNNLFWGTLVVSFFLVNAAVNQLIGKKLLAN